jgi:hypothetical protein
MYFLSRKYLLWNACAERGQENLVSKETKWIYIGSQFKHRFS